MLHRSMSDFPILPATPFNSEAELYPEANRNHSEIGPLVWVVNGPKLWSVWLTTLNHTRILHLMDFAW